MGPNRKLTNKKLHNLKADERICKASVKVDGAAKISPKVVCNFLSNRSKF